MIGTPLALRAFPAPDSGASVASLLDQVEGSTDIAYTGYVETLGTLQLPVASDLADLGPLFGERTRMRVWWRGPQDWRVDQILTTGETDLIHDSRGTTMWEYEKSRVTRVVDSGARLPRTSDLLPPDLGRRLLEDADLAELSRLPMQRIAGRDAPGMRLIPASAQSSIDHVDIWVDQESGLALRLVLYAKGADTAAFSSTFMQFSTEGPTGTQTTFEPPPDAEFFYDDVVDIADAANQFASLTPPGSLAGLHRSSGPALRSVGVYGGGLTQLVAIPLWDQAAEPLRENLGSVPTVRRIGEGDVVSVGPLTMLLTGFPGGGGWLLAGTVTEQTLIEAAHDIDRFSQVRQ